MSNHDPLGEALRHRADRLDDTSPLTLDDVKGRAQGIRRRRMAVSGLAAAAVIAVAVPAGLAISDRATGRPDNGPAASPSVTPTDGTSRTPDGTPKPGPSPDGPLEVALTANVEGHGGEPQIPYIFNGVINRPDGSTVEVQDGYLHFAPLGDGWVAVRQDEGGNSFLDVLAEDGSVTASYPMATSLAVSADATVASFTTPEGQLMTVTPGTDPAPLAPQDALPGGSIEPVGVLGSAPCDESADGGCTVIVNSQDGEKQAAYPVTSKGALAPLLLSAHGLSPDGSISGVVSIDQAAPGSCSVVLTPSGDTLWKTCDYTLGEFSPDGRYIVGRPAYLDGNGDGTFAILDAATGDPLVVYRNSAEHQATVYDAAWDQDDTLLATVHEGNDWSFMRMTVDGQLTALVSGLRGDDVIAPVVLPTGR